MGWGPPHPGIYYWLATPYSGIYGYSELLTGCTVPWDIWIFRVIAWLHYTLGYMDIQSYWLATPYPGIYGYWLHHSLGYMDIKSYWLATPFPGIYGYLELLTGYTVPWDIWIFRVIDWPHRTMDIQNYWMGTPYPGIYYIGWFKFLNSSTPYEQGPIDLCFIGSTVCWRTLLHCCLAYLKLLT